MYKKLINIICSLILIIVVIACEDTTKPIIKPNVEDSTLTQNYLIYYPLSQTGKSRPEYSGLFMYSYKESQVIERVLTESIVHISSVGKNGTVVFQYEYLPNKFWVRYLDGSTLPIPFPQLDQNEKDYYYSIPPHIELSGDGKKAVFFATIKRIDGTKPEENNLVLIVMDLPETTFITYELNQFLINKLNDDNVNSAEFFGNNIMVNDDGSLIYFVIKGRQFNNNQFTDIGYYIIQFSDGVLNKYTNKSIEPVEIFGFDEKAQSIFIKKGLELSKIDNSSSKPTSFTFDNFSNPHQFAKSKSEIVVWTDYGIEIFNSANESKIAAVISWDTLKTIYPDVKKMVRSNKLSISPDAGMIVFGFDLNTDPPSYDIFAIRRNGQGLKRLVANLPVDMPVVSWGLK